jgi:hypothetical protein
MPRVVVIICIICSSEVEGGEMGDRMPAINDIFFVVDVIHCFKVEVASEWPGIMLMMHASIIIYHPSRFHRRYINSEEGKR